MNKQHCARRNNQYQVLRFIVHKVWGHGEIFRIAALRKQTQQDQMYTTQKKNKKNPNQHEPRKHPEIRIRLHKQQARAVRCFVFQWDLQRTKQIKYQKTFSIAKKKDPSHFGLEFLHRKTSKQHLFLFGRAAFSFQYRVHLNDKH